jgi:hypothetical protein
MHGLEKLFAQKGSSVIDLNLKAFDAGRQASVAL